MLKTTSLHQGYVAILQTDFLFLHNTCIEFYYSLNGESNDTLLTVKVKHEVSFRMRC